MKELLKAALNWRYYILFVLELVGIVFLFAVPMDDSETWFSDLIFSKAVAVVAWYAWYRLVKRQDALGVIPEASEIMNEED